MAGKLSNENLKVAVSVHDFNQKVEGELNELKGLLDSLNFLLFCGNVTDGSDSSDSDVPENKKDVQGM